MSAFKGTPGHWTQEKFRDSVLIRGPHREQIARVFCAVDRDGPLVPTIEQGDANASLFAAAPLLLEEMAPETLEAIADEIGDEFKHSARADSLRVIARKQRAAIAAALGEVQS